MAGYALTMRHEIVVEELDQTPSWKLPEPAPMRTSGPLIQMESVTFAYPPASSAASLDATSGIDCVGYSPQVYCFMAYIPS